MAELQVIAEHSRLCSRDHKNAGKTVYDWRHYQAISHHHKRVRLLSTVDLVNGLELATAAARQARMANRLASAELLILAELGYLPFSQAGGALLFQLISLLCERTRFPDKYRRIVFEEEVDVELKAMCLEIEDRYQIQFLEIDTDKDHVHFLVQSVPTYSVTKLVTTIKSLLAREIFRCCPNVKKQLWGGELWIDGYFASTAGKHGDETMIGRYVKSQGQEYQKLHNNHQLVLF